MYNVCRYTEIVNILIPNQHPLKFHLITGLKSQL